MTDAKLLLNFSFDPDQFAADAKYLISLKTRECIEKATKLLTQIVTKNPGKNSEPPDIDKVYRTFMALAPKGIEALNQEFNTRGKVRKLVYSLSYYEGDPRLSILCSEFLPLALQIIDKHWYNGMLKGLFHILLQN
jgi:hypothetical protein